MKPPRTIRILADDLTGALDCAAAFGAGVPVHLGHPAADNQAAINIVATATRDVPPADLPALLQPSLAWLCGAGVAFKKIDSLLRGNTFDELDWLARQGGFQGLALVPAFPAQHRITQNGQQWWRQADGSIAPVAESISHSLQTRGWRVAIGPDSPLLKDETVAWVPDVLSDLDLDAVATFALQNPDWLWCGSAGLAHALARQLPAREHTAALASATGQILLVSASHHPVTGEQWRVLRSSLLSAGCLSGEDLHALKNNAAEATKAPLLIDLSSPRPLSPAQAAVLLREQSLAIAHRASRPSALVVVGGDTLLALCRALGANSLVSETALNRPGWGCARLSGGAWDGVLCHTRSGAFGNSHDLLEVINELQKNFG